MLRQNVKINTDVNTNHKTEFFINPDAPGNNADNKNFKRRSVFTYCAQSLENFIKAVKRKLTAVTVTMAVFCVTSQTTVKTLN